MRLGETGRWCGSVRANTRIAVFVFCALTVALANAQSSNFGRASQKSSSSGGGAMGSKLQVPTAEMNLLGGPSDLDSRYSSGYGGPLDESASTPKALTEMPATPTELLLSRTGASSVSSDAPTARMARSAAGSGLLSGDTALLGVLANPYRSPSGNATVYRTPW